jgi:hypothetical protein
MIMDKNTVLADLKKPLIEFIKKNLPASYLTMDEDSYWGVEIDEHGTITLKEYNGNSRKTTDFYEIPLSDLASMAESKFSC